MTITKPQPKLLQLRWKRRKRKEKEEKMSYLSFLQKLGQRPSFAERKIGSVIYHTNIKVHITNPDTAQYYQLLIPWYI